MHPSRGVAWVLGERLGRTDVSELRTRIGITTGQLADRVPPTERVLDVVVTAAWWFHAWLCGRVTSDDVVR